MSNTKAEQLALAVASIETSVNTIEALVAEAHGEADFNFVSDFRDSRGSTLQESGLIMSVLVKRMQASLNSLAAVLYVREMESLSEPVLWRHAANAGKRVKAITMLREFIGGDKLSVEEARDVVDTYLKHEF